MHMPSSLLTPPITANFSEEPILYIHTVGRNLELMSSKDMIE
jgi:hypothetical protein